MSSSIVRSGSIIRMINDADQQRLDAIPAEPFAVKFNPMMGFFLEQLEPFVLPKKLYSHVERHADRIINTYRERAQQTGVLLSGMKGSGKTLTAKTVCVKMQQIHKAPTLVVNQSYCGEEFNQFLQSIPGDAVVMFDEYEKLYDKADQDKMLTLLDGTHPMHKLFLLTCNDKWSVGECMHNRPGRIYYSLNFDGLDKSFVEEYCRDNMKYKDHIPSMLKLSKMFRNFNFDMLQALVEEVNRYNESPSELIDMLNTKPASDSYGDNNDSVRYQMLMLIDGKHVKVDRKVIDIDPLDEDGFGFYFWSRKKFEFKDIDLGDHEEYREFDEDFNDEQEAEDEDVYSAAALAANPAMAALFKKQKKQQQAPRQQFIRWEAKHLVRIDQQDGVLEYKLESDGHTFTLFLKEQPKGFDFKRHIPMY